MSSCVRPSAGHGSVPSAVGTHHLVRSWIFALLVVALLVTMPLIGGFADDLTIATEVLLLVVFTFVVVLFGAGAVVYGRRARTEGRPSGLVPATIGGFFAGFSLFVQVAALVAHLVGFE